MMNWLRKFMYGRYGVDELSIALLIVSLVLMIIGGFSSKLFILRLISDVFIVLYMFRIFSKNIYKRQQEYYKYLNVKNKIVGFIKGKSNRAKDLKTYKYFTCPNCKQKLRVPRGNGKITITCSKCKTQFKGKS